MASRKETSTLALVLFVGELQLNSLGNSIVTSILLYGVYIAAVAACRVRLVPLEEMMTVKGV